MSKIQPLIVITLNHELNMGGLNMDLTKIRKLIGLFIIISTAGFIISCKSKKPSIKRLDRKFSKEINRYSKDWYTNKFKDTTVTIHGRCMSYSNGMLVEFVEKYKGDTYYMNCENNLPVILYKRINDTTVFPVIIYNTAW